jgi:hypothetical protein
VNTRTVMWGILAVLILALVTGSVLLLGYVAAAASFLTIVGLLVWRAIRHRTRSPLHSLRAGWLEVGGRKAA